MDKVQLEKLGIVAELQKSFGPLYVREGVQSTGCDLREMWKTSCIQDLKRKTQRRFLITLLILQSLAFG